MCICYFLDAGDNRSYLFADLETRNESIIILKVINIIMFFGLNWLFLLMVILSVYHVRHIKDRLEIRKEMFLIVVAWSFFCMWQYLWYIVQQLGPESCTALPISQLSIVRILNKNAGVLTYCTTVARDLTVLVITLVFLVRVGRRENSLKQKLTKKEGV